VDESGVGAGGLREKGLARRGRGEDTLGEGEGARSNGKDVEGRIDGRQENAVSEDGRRV